MTDNNFSVFVYNSFNDPLFRGLLLNYLVKTKKKHTKLFLITYEQKKYSFSKEDRKRVKNELNAQGVYWFPLSYHSGSYILIKKLYDFFMGFYLIFLFRVKYNVKSIMAFTNVAGSIAFVFSRILQMKFIVFSYEPHSDFLVDLNLWNKNSLRYKVLNRLEYLMGLKGEVIITGTVHMVDHLLRLGAKGTVIRVPSCVDEEKFKFNEVIRTKLRGKLNINDRPCIIYLGKFGGLYYNEEIPEAFLVMQKKHPEYFFLVVTPDDVNELNKLFKEIGLSENSFFITNSSFEDVQDYISVADIGIVAIPPSPSQKYRSPVKVGEYLLTGIPYIVCEGISEDDIVAEKYNVGVVLKNFEEESILQQLPLIEKYLMENKVKQIIRCREVGKVYRGSRIALNVFSQIFQNNVLCTKSGD